MDKILVTGARGQLGGAFRKILGEQRAEFTDSDDLDVADSQSVAAVINKQPNLVIHMAAITNVDLCESDPALAHRVNALGTRHMALACRDLNIPLVYVSTDYVFGGEKGSPYVETDIPDPINYYGQSKYEGEKFVADLLEKYYIVRAAWLYGHGTSNFVYRVQEKIRTSSVLWMTDNLGSPTFTEDFALALMKLVETQAYGIYHLANAGVCSRLEWARKICELSGRTDVEIRAEGGQNQQLARRPRNTSLENTVASQRLGISLRPWEAALEAFMKAAVASAAMPSK